MCVYIYYICVYIYAHTHIWIYIYICMVLWWFHPVGQLNSTATALSLLPFKGKGGEKYSGNGSWVEIRTGSLLTDCYRGQTRLNIGSIPQVHAGWNRAIHSAEKGGRINVTDTNIHVQCFWNGFRYFCGSEWKRM